MRLRIERLGSRGDGVAMTDDGPVHVPLSAPGDLVEARILKDRKNGMLAEILTIIEPGPARRSPLCQHFGHCGGCALQHIATPDLECFPAGRIATALAHHGIADIMITPAAISPPGSRRRLALKALRTASAVLLGFHERASHRIVDIAQCPVAAPGLVALIAPLRQLFGAVLPVQGLGQAMVTLSASGIDLLLDLPSAPDLAAREALAAFAERHDLAALSLRDGDAAEAIAIRRTPVMDFGGDMVLLPAGGFVQATHEGEAALRQAVLDWSAGGSRAVDLFAGIGTFSLPLARHMPTLAVEGNLAACHALQGASAGLAPGRLTVRHRDLFRRPLEPAELKGFDIAVIDPPRPGAKAQMAMLAAGDVRTIIAISCNPNSFARDARLLIDGGYRLEMIRPVDQFLFSAEVELAALFRRP